MKLLNCFSCVCVLRLLLFCDRLFKFSCACGPICVSTFSCVLQDQAHRKLLRSGTLQWKVLVGTATLAGFYPVGGGGGGGSFHPKLPSFHPKNFQLQYKLLWSRPYLSVNIYLEWSEMASNATLYNLKTQIFLREHARRPLSLLSMYTPALHNISGHAQTHTHTHIHTSAQTHACTHTHTHTRTHTHARKHTHVCTCIHTGTHFITIEKALLECQNQPWMV